MAELEPVGAEEIFSPELHGWVAGALLEAIESAHGRDFVEQSLVRFELAPDQLGDASAWVSQRFAEEWCEELKRLGAQPELFDQAGRLSMSPKYLGPMYAFLRAFGSTKSTFFRIAQSSGRFNKTGSYTIASTGATSLEITFYPSERVAPASTGYPCQFRRATIASVPTIFDLAPARIDHPECLVQGGRRCVYEVSWQEERSRPLRWLGAIVAGLAAAWLTSSYDLSRGVSTGVVVGFALGGFALGRWRELYSDLRSRIGDLNESQDALASSLRRNEARFSEVLEAKGEIEQRVTERTAQLETALDELRALDRAKTEFFANVSHELRTPLTLILSPMDSLKNESNAGIVETMELNARRLLRMINQLLDLAKVDAKKVSIEAVPTNPRELLERVIAPYRYASAERSIRLTLGKVAESIIELDPTWMESAVSNLIANALRYAESSVVVSVIDAGSEIIFEVHDDGPGIDDEAQSLIFDRFGQARGTKGGTGIGLAIVQAAARLHGGTATVDVDQGTRFAIRIPRVVARGPAETLPPAPAPIVDPIDRVELIEERGPFPSAPRILVAEDHPELRRFIVDVLAPRFAVTGVPTGAEALEYALEHRPDVIVTDVMMPKMGGLELTRQLRTHDATKDVPVLLVTARGEPQDVIAGFDAGADDYIVKPFHGRELLARIDAQLRLRTMLHRLAHQERLASLGVLAASVAHQVRNPLTALVSGLPAVRAKIAPKIDERTKEMLDVFIDCSKRIERITLDLLDLSRVDREEDGKVRPGQGLMSAVRLTCAQLPADVEVHTDVDEDVEISGRAGDLNHVFLNLLDNASRAIDRKGTITIRGAAEAKRYRITIEDSGAGVAPDVADRIFEPFVTSRDAGEGTGLGLAIVSDVVKAHGGTIRCGRSEKLGGAEFVVELPI